MKFKCRIGWHNWGKWYPTNLTKVSTLRGKEIGRYTVSSQTKMCQDCAKEKTKEI